MSQVQGALTHLFNKHRIVFWYDARQELRSEFEEVMIPGVETLELANNEFAVKHRILRQQPDQKFLIYHAGPQPPDLDNWLLDVQLAQGVFRADLSALWLSELGLDIGLMGLVNAHVEFFKRDIRRQLLKGLLAKDDTETDIRIKMLAVCTASEPRMDEVLETLLAELAAGDSSAISLIEQCGLDAFLWERLKRAFGYTSQLPGIQDFAIQLFKFSYAMGVGLPSEFNPDALVFLRRWKDSISHHHSFETLSERFSEILSIEQDLQARDYRTLLELDLFRLIDQKVITDLVRHVSQRTISASDCLAAVRQRRRSHWYSQFEHLYAAIEYAAQFLALLDGANLSVSSISEGIQRYVNTWYSLDQLYRKVIYHTRKSNQVSVLESLVTQVENHYTNNYLLKLNNHWQQVVDRCSQWEAASVPLQRQFFERYVLPFLNNRKKVYVIISDALRYEIGEELVGRVRREDRYDAQLEVLLSLLPSYTQLGMAALLPNQTITITGKALPYLWMGSRPRAHPIGTKS
jgi:uncharacterized protein (TIGR02687 family)